MLRVHVTVLLCAFGNDNDEKMPAQQITNWAVFGEIQTATTTFVAHHRLVGIHHSPHIHAHIHGNPICGKVGYNFTYFDFHAWIRAAELGQRPLKWLNIDPSYAKSNQIKYDFNNG